jgi:hypothetical protein
MLTHALWLAACQPAFLRFHRALRQPARTQASLLQGLLATNAHTSFGQTHGFGQLAGMTDFQHHGVKHFQQTVPLRDYDDFAPWIERIAAGESNVLTAESVRLLEPSGGSTAPCKLIPYTAGLKRQFQQAVGPWICDLYGTRRALWGGAAYWSVSPLSDGARRSSGGVPIGFEQDSEYLGGVQKWLVERHMAVPSSVRHLADVDGFRYVTLLHMLRADLRLISVWNPTFLELLLDALPVHWDRLVYDVAHGTVSWPGRGSAGPSLDQGSRTFHVSATICRSIPELFLHNRSETRNATGRCLPSRATALRRVGPHDPTRIWPRLCLVSCWADAHAAPTAARLAARLPGVEVQPKGLLATEGVVTIPWRGRHVLAVTSHFFEFIDDHGRAWLAHELEPGGEYSVALTTAGGLYRYRLRDRVIVDGICGDAPTLRFIGKEDHMSDLRGEKLSEGFVRQVLERTLAMFGLRPAFAMLAPDDVEPAAYTLYLQSAERLHPRLADVLDQALRESFHYDLCRKLEQLGPVRIFRVDAAAADTYLRGCAATGRRLGDIKPTALYARTDPAWSRQFAGSYVAGAAPHG